MGGDGDGSNRLSNSLASSQRAGISIRSVQYLSFLICESRNTAGLFSIMRSDVKDEKARPT